MPLLLLLGALPAACTGGAADRSDVQAALERYHHDFDGEHPNRLPPALDNDYLLFAWAVRLVLTAHVDASDPEALVNSALDGMSKRRESDPATPRHELTGVAIDSMLAGLDPYSAYLDPQRVSDLRERIYGEFTGLGIEVAMDDSTGFLRVLRSSRDSPASRAGVRSGDLIVTIDGKQVRGLTLSDAATHMRGQAGRPVKLLVLRPNSKVPVQVIVTHAAVRFAPVTSRLEGGDIAYVSLANFNERTTQELTQALESLRGEAGGRLAGAVLDLRNNPGGLLEQGVKVAGRFLGAAEIVSTRGRDGVTQHVVSDDAADPLRGGPLVVLINGFSSSASEIVAGALQDYGRALVVGGRSYGKGSVQTIFWLPEGEGIRLTTAHYFRPSGATVECYGITPNVEVGTPTGREAIEPDRTPCNPTAGPPPPKRRAMADVCPDTARLDPGAKLDLPLACALSAIRMRRLDGELDRVAGR
ncbi:S41 family peptidase [Azospirillum sp. sgz301742]